MLHRAQARWKLTELAQAVDLNKSTVHGLMDTMRYLGWIDQDPLTQQYRLGTRMIRFGSLAESSLDIIAIARTHMEQLGAQVQETIHLGVMQQLGVAYIAKIESTQSMRITTARGSRNPSYCTGVGKVLMAYADEARREALYQSPRPAYTRHTITDEQALKEAFEQIRLQGYAMDDQEIEEGLTCIAMPIHEYDGRVEYAISISGPSVRMTADRLPQLREELRQTARQIERELGYQG